ncbi:hypothetical protein HTZ77_09100 [Nonomuraea sp. SMC257]|uniref:Uncharacterized protein n=1 Tax=Nonomuraea montanisoli TaxID=2741721 RepID=A0A7Y6I512_9ACTN|nr:hypothetical protein [Nonomuraea montanisoli]NUW31581.1 hypothetical protein [Nonomuraea montanisoli]
MLTADTYLSVLPQLYHDSARAIARLVLRRFGRPTGRSARPVTHDQMTAMLITLF